MNDFTKVILGVVGAGLLFWLISALNSEAPLAPADTSNRRQLTVVNDVSDRLDQKFKNDFMSGCVDGDSSWYTTCECMYNYLDTNLTNQEFIDMSLDAYTNGTVPAILDDAVWACS